MADPKAPKPQKANTVTVEALEWHTHDGKAYDVGDTYDIDEQLLESVTFQGKAVRADRVQEAARAKKAADKSQAARSHPVEPMTLDANAATTSKGTKARAPRAARGSKSLISRVARKSRKPTA